MTTKRYGVTLTAAERTRLLALTKKGRVAARTLTRAHILLQADAGATQETIAAALHVGRATVVRLCKRFVQQGLEAALRDRPRPGAQPKLDGKQEAFLIALACSTPPDGRKCWTMQLLANKLVELRVVETISDETVRRTLKKIPRSPGNEGNGVWPLSAPILSGAWKTFWTCTRSPTTLNIRWCVSMNRPISCSVRYAQPCP